MSVSQVLAGKVVAVTDGRLRQMQQQARDALLEGDIREPSL